MIQRPISSSNARFDPKLARRARDLFDGFLSGERTCGAWPGTTLRGHRARMYDVRFDASLLRRLVQVEDVLCNWEGPSAGLPEDPCLVRPADDVPLLFSVTHDAQAWVSEPPPAGVTSTLEPPVPGEQSFIPPAPSFCGPPNPRR